MHLRLVLPADCCCGKIHHSLILSIEASVSLLCFHLLDKTEVKLPFFLAKMDLF